MPQMREIRDRTTQNRSFYLNCIWGSIKMKVAIYCRVSKEEKGMQNPENQLIPCKTYCKAMGWEVVATYIDRASGGNSNRPEFQLMLSQAIPDNFDLILVWALDRFSREGINATHHYIKRLKHQGVHLKSMQESYIDTTKEGVSELILTIMSWVAAEERKKISERTKAGLARKRQKGVRLGRPPGSKDKKKRRKSGYYMRHYKEKQEEIAAKKIKRNGVNN